jgi:hypothetical protein
MYTQSSGHQAYTGLMSRWACAHEQLCRLRDVQRFLVEKEMRVLSFLANSSPEFTTYARSWIENVKRGTGLTFLCKNRLLLFRNNRVTGYYFFVIRPSSLHWDSLTWMHWEEIICSENMLAWYWEKHATNIYSSLKIYHMCSPYICIYTHQTNGDGKLYTGREQNKLQECLPV